MYKKIALLVLACAPVMFADTFRWVPLDSVDPTMFSGYEGQFWGWYTGNFYVSENSIVQNGYDPRTIDGISFNQPIYGIWGLKQYGEVYADISNPSKAPQAISENFYPSGNGFNPYNEFGGPAGCNGCYAPNAFWIDQLATGFWSMSGSDWPGPATILSDVQVLVDATAVPEPANSALLLFGGSVVVFRSARTKRKKV